MGGHRPGRRPEERPRPLSEAGQRVVRVLPDEPSIDREFDYLVPAEWTEPVEPGTPVRIDLHGRFLRAWVTAVDLEPPPGVDLKPLRRHGGRGPDAALVDLARWAAVRWAGRPQHLLRTATPDPQVHRVPSVTWRPPPEGPRDPVVEEAFAPARSGPVLVRLPPAEDGLEVARRAMAEGPALIVVPTLAEARSLAVRLRRNAGEVGLWPRDRAAGLGGATLVGTRSAVWARVEGLRSIVVVDEHDEAHQGQQAPTWHARDVALRRAAVEGLRCVLTSPVPSLHGLDAAPLLRVTRRREREGWPVLDVVDRRNDRPGPASLVSERLVDLVRSDRRVVVVLNRIGRARLLVCATCETTASCERCEAAVVQEDEELSCPLCGTRRPVVCRNCDSVRLKQLRPGVKRLRDDLAALVRDEVAEVTGADDERPPSARVVVGTEAVLHRVERPDVVVFADIDQEVLAPRFRVAEQALGLLARAARLLGGRRTGGRLVVQTRHPDHEVLDAVLHADPGRLVAAERARRELLRLPPAVALAHVAGAGAAELVAALDASVEVQGPVDGSYLVRAVDPDELGRALSRAPRPKARVRVEVDPPRL